MNPQEDKHFKETVLQLMAIKGMGKRLPFNPKRDRFDIPNSVDTAVHQDLNANRIIVNKENIAIASQYPRTHQLETQFLMMIENRTPALVVLASSEDMKKNNLSDYFSAAASFGMINTRSSFTSLVELGDGIEAKLYALEILANQTVIELPVIHVHNWPDFQTISPKSTSNLVALIDKVVDEKITFYKEKNSRALNDPNKLLPVIHCRAGVGRTGQTIAAMAMKRHPNYVLPLITRDLRTSRNNTMIQTPVQMETLLMMEKEAKT